MIGSFLCFLFFLDVQEVSGKKKNLIHDASSAGADEGIYAWIAANYALGTLGGDPQKTTGIFELGGASAQVLFSFQYLT